MSLRWLLCCALLLAIPASGQQSASPAQPAAQSAAKHESPVTEVKVECLPASRAAELIDQHGCVAGKVFRVTTQKNGATHISLCPARSDCEFHVVVFARDRDIVGDLSYLHGKLVAFVGDITNYRGGAELIMKDRQQMQVAAGAPPPQFDAERSKPSSNSTPGSKRGRAW